MLRDRLPTGTALASGGLASLPGTRQSITAFGIVTAAPTPHRRPPRRRRRTGSLPVTSWKMPSASRRTGHDPGTRPVGGRHEWSRDAHPRTAVAGPRRDRRPPAGSPRWFPSVGPVCSGPGSRLEIPAAPLCPNS